MLLLLVRLVFSVRCQESNRGRGARSVEPRGSHHGMRGKAKQASRRRGQDGMHTIERTDTGLTDSANVGPDAETAALCEHGDDK